MDREQELLDQLLTVFLSIDMLAKSWKLRDGKTYMDAAALNPVFHEYIQEWERNHKNEVTE